MTMNEALAYLESYSQMGSFYELETMRDLLDALGRPDRSLEIIHIAGTNGKGSLVAYLSAVLSEAGYVAGTYTSPSVHDYLERFTYHNKMIEKGVFAAITAQVAAAADRLATTSKRHATVFEMELAIAYLGALHYGCKIFIQETGLGGRLDATNVVEKPVLTVITAIGLDHTAELGDTLAAIAAEKAGIFKPGIPVTAYCNDSVSNAVLAERAASIDAPITFLDDTDIEPLETSLTGQRFRYRNEDYQISLRGPHQIKNAALAILATDALIKLGYRITPQACREGLRRAQWPGRFEVIHTHPDVILDGAHNPAAAQALAESIRCHYPNRRCIGIAHIFRDKDAAGIIAAVAPVLQMLVATSTRRERSLSADELAAIAREHFPSAHLCCKAYLQDAIHTTLASCEPDDAVFIFGSLSHLDEARQAVKRTFHPLGDDSHD